MFKVVHRLHSEHKPYTAVWLPDSSGLLLGTHSGITLWRWSEAPQSWTSGKSVGVLEITRDGRNAWAGGLIHAPGQINHLNLESGDLSPCPSPPDGTVLALSLTASQDKLFFGSSEGEIGIWDLRSEETSLLPTQTGRLVRHLALDAQEQYLAWIEEDVRDIRLYLWDLVQARGLLDYPLKNPARLLRFDGDSLLWGECGKNIQLYRLPLPKGKPPAKTKIPKTEFKQHTRPVMTLALSPDQRYLASASTYNEPKVLLWDAHSGQLLEAYTEAVTPTSLCFSPDGSMLAITASMDVRVLELA